MNAQDYGTLSREELRAQVRARKVGANGAYGQTSWAAMATADAMRAALAANDEGRIIEDASSLPGATGVGAVIEAALAAALSRPTLDVDAVEAIVRRVAGEVITALEAEAGTLRVVVDSPRAVSVDVGAQHAKFPLLCALLSQGIPVLLVGPKGSGKSEGVKHAARALAYRFTSDSFSADSGRHDVFGFVDGSSRYVGTAFRDAFENGAVYCGDELDNGTGNLGAAFNLALSNGHANFPDLAGIIRHADFRFAATANTLHGATLTFNGREPIDGALLDRCAVVKWDIDEAFERSLARRTFVAVREEMNARLGDDSPAPGGAPETWIDSVQAVRKALDAAGLERQSPSPRASINGAKMLATGMSVADCADVFLYRGADADTQARIRKAGAL